MRGRLLSALLLSAPLLCCNPAPQIQIVAAEQGKPVLSNYSFHYEHWLQPKIRRLYAQENLQKFVQQYGDEWQLQKAICNWTNAQWPPGDPNPYPLSNGLDILADIRSGKTKGFCGQYVYLFADALKAVGRYDVRYLELESQDHQFHFSAEVWSNPWQKWVVLDPFYNVYYSDEQGNPLSALELHELALAGNAADARINTIEKRDYQPPSVSSVGYYYSFAIGLRNDLAGLQAPLTVQDRLLMFLQYKDPALSEKWTPQLNYANVSSRKEDFQYTRNQIVIRYAPEPARPLIHCYFETLGSIAHFKSFLVSVDQSGWKEAPDSFSWKLKPGLNTLAVVGVNQFNLISRRASLKVKLQP